MNQDRELAPPPSHSLSLQQLEAITEQSRLLFLEEEAPENLAILKQGIFNLITKQQSLSSKEYTVLIRASHTLKGGAGIAQLPKICHLAHQLEDLFEQLIEFPKDEAKIELIAEKFQQIYELINLESLDLNLNLPTEKTSEEISHHVSFSDVINSPLCPEDSLSVSLEIDEISQFFTDFSRETPSQQAFIKNSLSVELEKYLQRLEAFLPSTSPDNQKDFFSSEENYYKESGLLSFRAFNFVGNDSVFSADKQALSSSPSVTGNQLNLKLPEEVPVAEETSVYFSENIKDALNNFAEEITLLSEVFNLFFLEKMACLIRIKVQSDFYSLEDFTRELCHKIRNWKEQILDKITSFESKNDNLAEEKTVVQSNTEEAENIQLAQNDQVKKSEVKEELLTIPDRFLKYIVAKPDKNLATSASLTLRVPAHEFDRLSDTVGELFINYEKLSQYQQQLSQTSRNLKKQIQQLKSLNNYSKKDNTILSRNRQQMPTTKDEIDEESIYLNNNALFTQVRQNETSINEVKNSISPKDFTSEHLNKPLNRTIFNGDFQDFYELVVQINESRSDIDLLTREFQETLDILHNSLHNLNENLTQSRLVNFGLLTDRFQASLQTLNQQYDKTVELVVEGKNLLIDQALLQQLNTPLTHLFRNAFDHGIETASERLKAGKPKIAKIYLNAQISGNYLTISLQDDGRGIDIKNIYNRAKQMGLIDTSTPIEKFKKQEILDFLFSAGFSTAAQKSDLSGRGVGLDIVRYQISRMRGTVQVETRVGYGTKFTINVPFKLRVVKLLFCRCGTHNLAIPCLNILEIINLLDHPFFVKSNNKLREQKPTNYVVWNGKNIRVFSLIDLLEYGRDTSIESTQNPPPVGLVLEVNNEPIVLAVDAILQECELVIKPFDETVPVPSYLAGCTVLGNGEIVPVISPQDLREKIIPSQSTIDQIISSFYLENNSETTGLQQEWNDLQSAVSIVEEIQREDLDNREIKEQPLEITYSTLSTAFCIPKPAILIADDSIAVRRALDQLLSQAGYHVTQCNDGKAALEELKRSGATFDLVISDLDMPRLSGFELLASVRSNPHTRNVPFAILSSRDSEQCRQRAASYGVTAYFTKPWEPTFLLNEIAALLS
ncbi:MAG TPA: response regulator [Halomicronema sp.]